MTLININFLIAFIIISSPKQRPGSGVEAQITASGHVRGVEANELPASRRRLPQLHNIVAGGPVQPPNPSLHQLHSDN